LWLSCICHGGSERGRLPTLIIALATKKGKAIGRVAAFLSRFVPHGATSTHPTRVDGSRNGARQRYATRRAPPSPVFGMCVSNRWWKGSRTRRGATLSRFRDMARQRGTAREEAIECSSIAHGDGVSAHYCFGSSPRKLNENDGTQGTHGHNVFQKGHAPRNQLDSPRRTRSGSRFVVILHHWPSD